MNVPNQQQRVCVDLWCAPEPAAYDPILTQRYATLLSGAERARWQRFVREADRNRFLLARALVRTVLAAYRAMAPQDLEFTADAWGKPHLLPLPQEQTPPHFNLSHTQGMAVLAVSRQAPLGVDVERVARVADAEALALRYFAPEEWRALQALPHDERQAHFLRLWTLKEAYVKALGLGLRMPLDSFAFSFAGDAVNLTRREGQGAEEPMCVHSLLLAPRHRVGLAVRCTAAVDLRLYQGLPLCEPWRTADPAHALR
ncbi:MAG: 4'-phosphopantetheinyl transferase superfamily protein [Pseudomonadales bacterium]|jgi:4'-phosphopantetheinyl transferase|nr:4'-phosphopantetheinyl transferase superfamily protein [Pseudomonadales bacterium]